PARRRRACARRSRRHPPPGPRPPAIRPGARGRRSSPGGVAGTRRRRHHPRRTCHESGVDPTARQPEPDSRLPRAAPTPVPRRRRRQIRVAGRQDERMTGSLALVPAAAHPELVAAPVAAALAGWHRAPEVRVAPIDADLADTAAFCAAYDVPLEISANCVIVAGRRGEVTRHAACLVLATTRLDVNGTVRGLLEARKAS